MNVSSIARPMRVKRSVHAKLVKKINVDVCKEGTRITVQMKVAFPIKPTKIIQVRIMFKNVPSSV